MSRKYKMKNPDSTYFVSFATVYWIDVFIREIYFEAIIQSLEFCRKEKGMILYSYCIMPSHVHLLFQTKNQNPVTSGFVSESWEWKYSSARNYCDLIAVLDVDIAY